MEEYGPQQFFGITKALLEEGFIVLIVNYYSSLGALACVKVDACFRALEVYITRNMFINSVITVSHCIGMIIYSS
jgi:hypothetical protein